MSGIYGTFYENFLELQELFEVWDKEDASDMRKIVAIYMPDGGDGIKRRKYTSGNTGLDITESENFYISSRFADQVNIGSYVRGKDKVLRRLTQRTPYDKAAGYQVYIIERVTGATKDKSQSLGAKEGYFA